MQVTLLPALDCTGTLVVVGDTIRSVYPADDWGGRVEKIDGVMLTISVRYSKGVYVDNHLRWSTFYSQAKDVKVCR